ncbi:MAG: hypothetical protein WD766_04595 [Gemmatimonadota bacterium]
MDLLLLQIMAAYRQNPGFTVFVLVLSAIVGLIIGFGVLGPALVG